MKKIHILAISGLVLSLGVLPSLAEEIQNVLDPAPESSAEPQPTPEPSPQPTPEPSPQPTPEPSDLATVEPSASSSVAAREDSDIEPVEPTASPSETPPAPLSIQPRFILRAPLSSPVDPRAKTFYFPSIYMSSDLPESPTLVCISGIGVLLDVGAKGVTNESLGLIEIKGDRSTSVLLSGTTTLISQAVNSAGGLLAYSTSTGLAGRSILIQAVALNKHALKKEFCGAAARVSQTTFRALGLSQSVTKGEGVLKR